MTLKLICQHCQTKYNRKIAELDKITDEVCRNVAKQVIPEPKPVTVESEVQLGQNKLVKYSCGHSVIINGLELSKLSVANHSYPSLTKGYASFDYQTEGIKFIVESNFNCLIADEMGLGKTVQAIVALREYIDKMTPCIIIVKAATIYQWIREFKEWGSLEDLGICPIISSKIPIIPAFKTYIVSMDLLPDILDKLIALQPKLVIADEVQSFKNRSSKRSQALVNLIQRGAVAHKVFLSGTPIKNRAGEYFTVLNLLAPGVFPNWKNFVTRWLEPNEKGQFVRIRKYALPHFRELTKKWILRRECSEVQKDLPPLRTVTTEIEITDPVIKKSYNAQLDLFSNFMNHGGKINAIEMLGWLAKLRRLTAQAKVPSVVEKIKDFLDSTEDAKVAIGIHHKSVRDELFFALEPYGALRLSGEDSAEQKDMIVRKFQSPEYRVLIINEVSGGTGLDGLQCCHNVFVLERQWNAADEDQFIKRFLRTGQKFSVLQDIQMAHGTIDVFFDEMVRTKRAIGKATYENDWSFEGDVDSLRELADRVIAGRLS